jgi:flagellin
MSNITLSSAVRSNVLTLQMIADQQSVIQNRLSTGKKVNSALDNPRNFFQSSALNNRAADLGRRLDGMGLAIKTIEAADKAMKGMTKLLESMAAVAKDARDSSVVADRATLGAQFNTLRLQLMDLAEDAGFNGINLLAGNNLTVDFNEDATNFLTVTSTAYATDAVGTNAVVATTGGVDDGTNWAAATLTNGTTAIDLALGNVDTAISALRTQAARLGTSLTTVKIREEFTKEMINTLRGGADGLVLADQNEEAANLLSLNTRQQLSQQALSLATQSEQSILRLFG